MPSTLLIVVVAVTSLFPASAVADEAATGQAIPLLATGVEEKWCPTCTPCGGCGYAYPPPPLPVYPPPQPVYPPPPPVYPPPPPFAYLSPPPPAVLPPPYTPSSNCPPPPPYGPYVLPPPPPYGPYVPPFPPGSLYPIDPFGAAADHRRGCFLHWWMAVAFGWLVSSLLA